MPAQPMFVQREETYEQEIGSDGWMRADCLLQACWFQKREDKSLYGICSRLRYPPLSKRRAYSL